jgi:hypothetical protein
MKPPIPDPPPPIKGRMGGGSGINPRPQIWASQSRPLRDARLILDPPPLRFKGRMAMGAPESNPDRRSGRADSGHPDLPTA